MIQQMDIPTVSKFKMEETVVLNFYDSGKIKGCRISAIHFHFGKVRYDILVPLNDDEWTELKAVDSVCIEQSN